MSFRSAIRFAVLLGSVGVLAGVFSYQERATRTRSQELSFPQCNSRSTDLDQAKLQLVAIFVDGLDLDGDFVAEPHLAACGVAAQAVLALAKDPEVAADRGNGNHPLHEDLVELYEEAKRGDSCDDAGEREAHFVA